MIRVPGQERSRPGTAPGVRVTDHGAEDEIERRTRSLSARAFAERTQFVQSGGAPSDSGMENWADEEKRRERFHAALDESSLEFINENGGGPGVSSESVFTRSRESR
jgi:hypothetical protein